MGDKAPFANIFRVHHKKRTMPAGHGIIRRRRQLEPPLAPSVLAARNKEMKLRLSASSLVLGDVGPETRDWSLSSTQPRPTEARAVDPAQRAKKTAMKKGTSRHGVLCLSTHVVRCYIETAAAIPMDGHLGF